jgi:transcriptional regulator with XRE-family HTH domain
MAVGTTRGKRRLGRYIKPLRLRTELKPEELAVRADCARQTVTRLESGVALPRIHLFRTILSELDVTEDERARALQLWAVADVDTATIERAQDLPMKYRRFRMDESEATRERTLDTLIIPGLLQTSEYAAAKAYASRKLIRGSWDAEAEAAERRDRQGLLRRESGPLELHALIDEVALRRMIGGPDVMEAQLDHLLTMGELPHITIQTIPFAAGAYGVTSGAVILLSFPEDDEPDAAYAESLTGLHTMENEESVSALSVVWDDVAAAALPANESAEFIRAARDTVREP